MLCLRQLRRSKYATAIKKRCSHSRNDSDCYPPFGLSSGAALATVVGGPDWNGQQWSC